MAKSKRPETDEPPDSSALEGREAIHGGKDDYGDGVAMRAYELYLARGKADGRDFDDWITAERELGDARGRGKPAE